MSGESRELKTMRQMAWQRAKGELNAILEAFWFDKGEVVDDGFEHLTVKFEAFIKDIEEDSVLA